MNRISIVLEILNHKDLIVNYNLNWEISSFIYSILKNEYPRLHESKEIKDFCFSNIIFKDAKYESDAIHLTNNSRARLLFSSNDVNKLNSLILGLCDNNKNYSIGNINFKIHSIHPDNNIVIDNEVNFKTETPICVTSEKDGKTYYVSLKDDEKLFIECLKKNMIHKNNFIDDSIDIEIDRTTIKQKRIAYKNTSIMGFLFNFKIKANKETIEKSFNGGFGTKNSLGFGYVNINK